MLAFEPIPSAARQWLQSWKVALAFASQFLSTQVLQVRVQSVRFDCRQALDKAVGLVKP